MSEASKKVAEKKGYSNPALEAMGIKRIRLPSRNWLIFLGVTTAVIGGILYDKREQKKYRNKWMEKARHSGEVAVANDVVPRKLTIFIAPPPNDYLEESYKNFRKYIKPILNLGGIDFEVFTSSTQGQIRYKVASDIRKKRRELSAPEPAKELGPLYWTRVSNYVVQLVSKDAKDQALRDKEREQVGAFNEKIKNVKNFLSVYYNDSNKSTMPEAHNEDVGKPAGESGGVLVLGRGTYKEYMMGVHEGYLGPLERPDSVIEDEAKAKHETLKKEQDKLRKESKNEEELIPDIKSVEELIVDIRNNQDPEISGAKPDPESDHVTRAYIYPVEYESQGRVAEELKEYLEEGKRIPEKGGVAPYYQQAISVMAMPNILGFLVIPQKIYRFYNKRYLADDYGRMAYAIVENANRPFDVENDVNLAVSEELDWPKKWIQTATEKNSDWVQEFSVDKRVAGHLRVFDDKLLPELQV